MAVKASGFIGKSAISVHLDFSSFPVKFSCLKQFSVSSPKPLVVLSVALSSPARTVESPPVGYRKNVGICLVSPCRKVTSFFFSFLSHRFMWFGRICPLDLDLKWFWFCRFLRRQRFTFRIHGRCLRWISHKLYFITKWVYYIGFRCLSSFDCFGELSSHFSPKQQLLCSVLSDIVFTFVAKEVLNCIV